ncbi:preprotein translocase subunit SecG [Jhaorihella thermophila]|uniref:Protein-export membrane protein SecG n=1 Tax=Jhaorihella thermophila TaxID=488547 RepID=A0A1H5VXZ3_9RHOB|nr:preprotein translocase subunit SecG [Jhaorihella thermophila]SEF92145.1 preprotein translocase subunit SecG [Jhaorihella thermophila]
MENVVLIIHLLLALGLIGVVLLQRSEGGGLGMGGGGVVSGRQAATALSKVTWALAIAFIATSMTLTIIAAQKSAGSSVLDRVAPAEETAPEPVVPTVPSGGDLLPPSTGETAPQVPRAD